MNSVSLGGSKQKASMIEIANDKSWEYTVLGLNNAWIEEIEIPDHLKFYLQRSVQTSQLYQGDDVCIDGSKRNTVVLYECGKVNHIRQFRVNY